MYRWTPFYSKDRLDGAHAKPAHLFKVTVEFFFSFHHYPYNKLINVLIFRIEKVLLFQISCCETIKSKELNSDWMEFYCKSGELLFHYNKKTTEHRWPDCTSTDVG